MAKVRVVLRSEASADVTEAVQWYDEKTLGLGDEFVREVDRCFERIAENPDTYEVIYERYRRALLRRFPYVVYYQFERGFVEVFAVVHCAQQRTVVRRRLLP